MLAWDGSDLGTLSKYLLIATIKYRDFTYWKFRLHGDIHYCMSRLVSTKDKGSHQCIIDESKVIFGLPKLGTHRIRYQGKNYLLSKVPMANDYTVQTEFEIGKIPDLDTCLAQYPDIKYKMQNLMAFWDIMGIKATDNCAILRNFGTEMNPIWSPVGFKEISINPREFGHFSKTMIRRWFSEMSISQATLRLIDVTNSDRFFERQIDIRQQLQDIIKRIDPKVLHLSSEIIRRLINRVSGVI